MAFAVWSIELWPISDCGSDSSTVDAPGTLLDFFDSGSRDSSWHRCPMLRLIHLTQGLSCVAEKRGKRDSDQCLFVRDGNSRRRGRILHTRSHVMCWKPAKIAPGSVRTFAPIYRHYSMYAAPENSAAMPSLGAVVRNHPSRGGGAFPQRANGLVVVGAD